MNLSTGSQGAIRGIILSLSTLLILSAGGYFGYNYYKDQVSISDITPVTPQETSGMKNTTQEILVTGITGTVAMKTASGDIQISNETRVPLEQSEFHTQDDSHMTLIFSDRSLLRLDANTQVSVHTGTDGNTIVTVQVGRIWARVIGSAGGIGNLRIVLGNTQAIVQGTSLEALKLPLLSKFTVIDSSSASGSESSGIDVIDANGAHTQVFPEQKWTSTEFGTGIVKPISIENIYRNDAFVLMNTQQDIVHLQDAVMNHADNIDIEKAKREILASLPIPGTDETSIFFSGSTIRIEDLSGHTTTTQWSTLTETVLAERADDYESLLKQNAEFIKQIINNQEKLQQSLLLREGKIEDNVKEMTEGILRKQEVLLSNVIMQNNTFVEKINQDIASLLSREEKMTQEIVNNTMNMVNTTVTNSLQDIGNSKTSLSDDAESEDTEMSNIEDDDFFQNTESPMENNSQKETSMDSSNGSMSNGSSSVSTEDISTISTEESNSMDNSNGSMSNGTSTMSNGTNGMSMGN